MYEMKSSTAALGQVVLTAIWWLSILPELDWSKGIQWPTNVVNDESSGFRSESNYGGKV